MRRSRIYQFYIYKMANIYLRGNRKPIYVSDEKGKVLKDLFSQQKMPDIVALDNVSFRSAEVKTIELDGETAGTKSQSAKDINEQYRQDHKRIRSLTAFEKSQRLGFFELFYWVFTGIKQVPRETLEEARVKQEAFFKNNPKRTLPDLMIFKDMIEGKELKDANDWASKVHKSGAGILENALITDIREAKYA